MGYFEDIEIVNYDEKRDTAVRQCARFFDEYYGIQFNWRGRCELWVGDGRKYCCEGPHVFFTYPGVAFNYGAPPGEIRTHLHVCFRGTRVKRWIESGLFQLKRTEPFCEILEAEKLRELMLEVMTLQRVPGGLNHGRTVLLLEEVLLRIAEQPTLPRLLYRQYADSFETLRRKIVMQPGLDWNFKLEAHRLAISEVHFRRLFKDLTGLPPGTFLRECRMRLADKLLLEANRRVAEVAVLCGFHDEFHFSKMFRKYRGESPRSYRTRLCIK